MNRLDLIIVVCFGIGIIKGLFDGLVKQVVSLVALTLSILFAGWLAVRLQGLTGAWDVLPPYLEYPVCYVVAFVLILLVLVWTGRRVEKVINWSFLGCINSAAGGLVGALITVIVLSLACNFFVVFDSNSRILSEQTKTESVLFNTIRAVTPTLYPYVKHKVEDKWKERHWPGEEEKKEKEPEPRPEEKNQSIFEL